MGYTEAAMDESLLWIVALGSGLLGVLLLVVAGVATIYWRRGAQSPPARPASQPLDEAADDSHPPPASGGGFWTWAKAGLFAIIHSLTVGLVLGGVTFFEDLVRASQEIQQTGSVTFPKQLLPESVTNPAIKQISRPDSDEADWEVVSSSAD
ncbi:MAG TPA: hypothetical protein ENK17_01820 [Anaerolineae bacterium]|nr:hypothetical protein [Anaerolineae bacterium]